MNLSNFLKFNIKISPLLQKFAQMLNKTLNITVVSNDFGKRFNTVEHGDGEINIAA